MNNNLSINLPIFNIVRYDENGNYDCMWKSGLRFRDAIKKCKELNSDYHKYYGEYVVEDNYGKKYRG